MPQGVFKWFDPERGYGLITPDVGRTNLFMVRSTSIEDGELKKVLKNGDRVTYEVTQGRTGMQVKNVTKI
jgi:CspA family cold shock protein